MEMWFAEHMPEHAKGVHLMIAACDHNGDNEINLEEAIEMKQAKEEGDMGIRARYMFRKIADKDGDGVVSKHEYHTCMMCIGMGPDLTEKYMNEDFAQFDADGDGQMSYEEFKVWTNMHSAK